MNGGELKQAPRLIAKLCDGSIAPDEMEQLNRQLLADPIAMEAYIDHLEVDAMLEREFGGQPLKITPRSQSFRPGATPSAGYSLTRRLVGAAVAAALVVALGLFLNSLLRSADDPPVATDQPLVVQSTDDTQVRLADGSSLSLDVGRSVRAGETILTNEGDVLLRYDDGTEIGLSASSSLKIGESADEGKRLELQEGVLQAAVSPQTSGHELVITTPHIAIRVLGTRFELEANESSGTRLDLESGRVELVRDADEPVVVEANSIAVVRSADAPVRITPRPPVIAQPDREAQFPRLRSFDFSGDGRTIVAMTDRGAIYWRADDEIETVRAVTEDDVKVVTRSGSLVLFEEREPRRLVFWDAASGETVRVVDDLDQIPAVFAFETREGKRPSFPSLWIDVLSPRGDWIAVHKREGMDAMHLFDLDSGRTLVIERNHLMLSFRVSPDGSMLAIGQTMGRGKDGPAAVVELFATATGQPMGEFVLLKGREKKVPGIVPSILAFSANGRRLAVGVRDWLQVWDVATGERIVTIEDAESIREIAVSPTGDWVAGARRGHAIRLWKVDDPSDSIMLGPAGSHGALTFSPDGQVLASMLAGGRLWMWELNVELATEDSK